MSCLNIKFAFLKQKWCCLQNIIKNCFLCFVLQKWLEISLPDCPRMNKISTKVPERFEGLEGNAIDAKWSWADVWLWVQAFAFIYMNWSSVSKNRFHISPVTCIEHQFGSKTRACGASIEIKNIRESVGNAKLGGAFASITYLLACDTVGIS